MKFNPDKCKVMHVTRSKNPILRQYTLHSTVLETVESSKYLGVTLNQDLSFNKHMDFSIKKASDRLRFVHRNLYSASKETKSVAYFTLVHPIVEYASIVWDPHYKTYIQNVEMVQRSAARFVCNRYHNKSSITEMLDDLNWPTLAERCRQARLSFMYKIVNGLVDIPKDNYLFPPTRVGPRTKPHLYQLYQCETNYFKHSFFPWTVVEWNHLPAEVAAAPSLELFKASL